MVWRKNDEQYKEVLKIKGHLFGRQRMPLGRVGRLLKQEFDAACFYCTTPLGEDGEVDHVLPWSIIPIDGVTNLVVSCRRCNSSKSDNLPVLEHVDRAVRRSREVLERIAAEVESDPEYEAVVGAATNLYYQASATGQEVWRARREPQFVPLDLTSPPDWMCN